jgi:hypothetical protein
VEDNQIAFFSVPLVGIKPAYKNHLVEYFFGYPARIRSLDSFRRNLLPGTGPI